VRPHQYYFGNAAKGPRNPSLYTRAIRYALARLLATSVPLPTVVAGFTMAGRSWIKDMKQPRWLILSVLCYAAVISQTAGYDVFIVSIRTTC
jgi:hypothetical protein